MNTIFESVEMDCLNCLIQFKQKYQRTDNKAIVFIMKQDFWSENEAKREKEEIIQFLTELDELLVLVLDCECSGSIIDFWYSFDLCLATENAKLSNLVKSKESSPLIRLIAGKKCLESLYALESIQSNELLHFGFVSRILSLANQASEIEEYLLPILSEKSKFQISSIKTCFRSYKQATLDDIDIYNDRMKSVEQEMEQFCKLALIKFKELDDNYDG